MPPNLHTSTSRMFVYVFCEHLGVGECLNVNERESVWLAALLLHYYWGRFTLVFGVHRPSTVSIIGRVRFAVVFALFPSTRALVGVLCAN